MAPLPTNMIHDYARWAPPLIVVHVRELDFASLGFQLLFQGCWHTVCRWNAALEVELLEAAQLLESFGE